MDSAENALFKNYDVICLPLQHSTVPDELSMNRSDSDGFFLRRRVCMFRDSSGKTTVIGCPIQEVEICKTTPP